MGTDELKDIIRQCYQDLLDREPDELGLNYYLKLFDQNKINSKPQLIELIKNSPEYLEKNSSIDPKFVFSEEKDYSNGSRIIAMYRIKNESRWIKQSLESILEICNEIVILDGVAGTAHDGKAFCAAEEDLCRTMESNNINMIRQGFITGVAGGLLNECLMRKIQGVTLLVKADAKDPDPLAAATLIEAVNRAYGMNIDTSDLRKKKKQIGADFKELSDKYTEHRKINSNMYM